MVNELNRPPNGDNAALSERLAASNRQLQEMQEEHRQLLEEMETLRTRAAELTRLNAQRQQLRQTGRGEEQQPWLQPSPAETPAPAAAPVDLDPVAAGSAEAVQEEEEEDQGDEDKEETASYLQEKLNEIANLKAQFKRVQHMVDTTKLIEQHVSTRESVQTSSTSSQSSSRQTTSTSNAREVQVAAETEDAPQPDRTAAAPDNAELLSSMLNMFTDFTSDLRGQAESLRAERDRIRTLKEEIIQRKQGK
ncbi:LOW QUALITY PROTEIN: zinc finger protein 853 [Drosophila subobscura]|uniref:LOW QUALITY PROTEIN: zinc finger protein 853 n=1 Tax=Drosophila subobscura TaxID=7241 RepID=UPI00155AD48B|nr:LOW QUALITY PROTEIN: zinc finger protein 853 [Drosophila subobscura]